LSLVYYGIISVRGFWRVDIVCPAKVKGLMKHENHLRY